MPDPILEIYDLDNRRLQNNTGAIIADSIHMPEEVDVEIVTHTLNLYAGWNLISTYVNVDSLSNKSLSNILYPLVSNGNLIIAKDYLGSAYLPEWNFNGIGDWKNGQAYQIKLNNSQTLEITGERMVHTTPQGSYYGMEIEIQGGWNFIGIPTIGVYNLVEVFDMMRVTQDTNTNNGSSCSQGDTMSIGPANLTNCGSGAIIIIKNYLGSAYLPEWNFNGIGSLLPGQGYQIKMFGPSSNKYKLLFTESSISNEWVLWDGQFTDENPQ
jgi:hypothetical protein